MMSKFEQISYPSSKWVIKQWTQLTTLTTWEVAKELNVDHFIVIRHLKQIGSWKTGRSISRPKKKKTTSFWSVFYIVCNSEPFLNQIVMYNSKWQPLTTSSVAGLKRNSKALSQAKLAPKKGHGHCLVVCCPSDPLQLSESLQNSANWWDEPKLQRLKPILINRDGPVLHKNAWQHVAQSVLQKLDKLGYKVLPHPPYSPDLLSTDYHFFRHLNNFFQGKCFHNQQEAEMLFKSWPNPKAWMFTLQE